MAKNITKTKMILFEGTEAHFSLSVEAHFTRTKNDGSVGNLIYVSDNGIANLNPNIYLIFAYRGDTYEESKSIFTSFPQLHKIRKALRDLSNLMENPNSFVMVDNALSVRPECNIPFTISNIGQNQNWISFSPVVALDSSGIVSKAVQVRFSGTELASVLSEDEFFTIVEILNDIDLASIKASVSSLVLLNNNDTQLNAGFNNYGQNYYNNRPVANNGRFYQNVPGQVNGGAPMVPQQRTAAPGAVPSYQRTGRVPQQNAPIMEMPTMQPNTVQAPNNHPVQNAPTPTRNSSGPSAPIVNLDAIESEAPSFSMSYDDPNDDMINSIFGE